MQAASIGAFAPFVLLCAAFGSWSLISLLFLLAFFIVQYNVRRSGPLARPRPALWMSVVLLATSVIVTEGVVELIWAMLGSNWDPSDSPFLEVLGLGRLNPWAGGVFLSLLPQFAAALVAACALYQEQQQYRAAGQDDSERERQNGSATLMDLLLPSAQLLVGVARPSWVALPYFVCSCVGLLHWSVTSSNVGLSRFWKPLLCCTGLHIFLLYLYQLPISFPDIISDWASYVGLFKASDKDFGWPEGVQVAALTALYILMCLAINDLQDKQPSQQSAGEGSEVEGSLPSYRSRIRSPSRHVSDDPLTQTLLPSQQEASSMETIPLPRRWDAEQRRAIVFQHATINFITYGFPICLIALVCWSFIYASLCAFCLLLYVGYIFYACPSIHILRRLNPILLGFILSWSLSTYVFNAAFSVISEQSQMGMEIWHSIGLWHYFTPGLFIFAQFALGVLVATDIFVSNVVLKNMSDESPPNDDQGLASGDQNDWKVLILAVVAWCLRRSAYVLSLVLIFVVGMKDGVLNAVYMGFFLIYLVSSAAAKQTRRHLLLFCEIHFAALYLLQLDWISGVLKAHEDQLRPILLQLGLWEKGSSRDFVSIAALLCFLAVESHGVKVLSSLSATIHQSPHPPLGWGILRVGSGRSILLSVYASQNFGYLQQESSNEVNWVTKHLSAIAENIRSTYRSFGTYIVYGTVLTVIYFVEPNYISLGYLCLLLVWVIGRQILGHTKAPLWYPLMVFAGVVLVFRYALTAIPALQDFTSEWFSLHKYFGFDKDASLLEHLWDSLAILTAMQLYRFERGQIARQVFGEAGDEVRDSISYSHGAVGFMKRFIILHCGKALTLTVFYSCITPVSAIGFLYLVMLIIACNMSKSSRLPAQLYSVYTGLLAVTEYLFQMWGDQVEMFPGQTHGEFVQWIGFRVYSKGFTGTELGLRTKVLVLVFCILQYCSFHWLDELPTSLRAHGQFEEPCLLFLPYSHRSHLSYKTASEADSASEKRSGKSSQVGLNIVQPPDALNAGQAGMLRKESTKLSENSERGQTPKKLSVGFPDIPSSSSQTPDREVPGNPSFPSAEEIAFKPKSGSPWGSRNGSRRWTKRAELIVKKERYEAQLRTLRIYVKYILENCFQLYGLELSMFSLLVASFILLNVISLLYVFVLGLCIVLSRSTLRTIWPFFVIAFASVLVTEYGVLGKRPPSWKVPPLLHEPDILCNNCAYSSTLHSAYCWGCWLGLVVDDRQMLAAHFMVFFFTSLHLRGNMLAGSQHIRSIHSAQIPTSDRLAWKETSFKTSGQWTWLDHVRFFFYRHLLHVVLLLVFATGTLQYDVLHLGYLTFSLVLFRMRSTIMIKRNSIFRFLRLYNFILIGASLIYQAPSFGHKTAEKCAIIADLFNVVGLYKMKFGFRITARSALVDITIFCVTGLQAYVFRSREFDQVLRYLESEQVEARAHAQEDKATWKKEHLQRIRATEERKLQRRLQVEKIKTDMVHLQLRLDVLNSTGKFNGVVSPMIELDDRGGQHPSFDPFPGPNSSASTKERHAPHQGIRKYLSDSNLAGKSGGEDDVVIVAPLEHSDGREGLYHAIRQRRAPQIPEASSPCQIDLLRPTFSNSDVQSSTVDASSENAFMPTSNLKDKSHDDQFPKQSVMTGVQLIEDGVAQVHSLGNKALANLVGLLNLEQSDKDETETSSTDDDARSENKGNSNKGNSFPSTSPPTASCQEPQLVEAQAEKLRLTDTWRRVSILRRYFWSWIASNTDIVCYFFFVIAYIWNFSLLTLVYPAVLFLHALLANPGPRQQFWFLMLVYTELHILAQYMYQIHVQNCDGQEVSAWLQKLGFPGSPMNHSFVISVLPLFLVYLSTSVQSSIKARDGEWMFVDEGRAFLSSRRIRDPEGMTHYATVTERLWKINDSASDAFYSIRRGLSWYWRALGSGSEAPPHFVQVSLHVGKWPEDGIQPERIESQFNRLLAAVHQEAFPVFDSTREKEPCSRVRVESIENSPEKHSMALAVLEVIYAARPQGIAEGRDHQTLTPAADVASELQKARDEGQLDGTGFPYPIISVIPGGKREVDLYALIFGTDLISFLYVALFYQSAVKRSAPLLNVYQVEDQFPKEFVFVLMVCNIFLLLITFVVFFLCVLGMLTVLDICMVEHSFSEETYFTSLNGSCEGSFALLYLFTTLFFLIMLDRVIYLCSFATGKVAYYFFCLGLYTGYVSEFGWGVLTAKGSASERHFWQLLLLRGFYMMKALSLSLQAVQLKYGLPHKSTLYGQFLTRKINATSWLGFRLYRSLPFLYELRCLLDWSCTTTALSMYDWLKALTLASTQAGYMVDLVLFDDVQPHQSTEKLVEQAPFLEDIYASLFLVQCDIKLVREKHRLGQKQGVWIKFCSGVLLFLTLIGVIWTPMLIYSSGNPTNIVNRINNVRTRIEVKTGGGKFTLFETGLCQVPFLDDAGLSSKSLENLHNHLSSYDPRDVQIICCEENAESHWSVPPPTIRSLVASIGDDFTFQTQWEFHRSRPKGNKLAVVLPERPVEMNVTLVAQQFRQVLNGTLSSVEIPSMYPRYFRVPGSGDVRTLDNTNYVSGNLTLNQEGSTWWSFRRSNEEKNDGCDSARGPMAVTVSEEVPDGIIGETLSKFSIWSLYITFVLAVGRFIRLQCSDIRMRIPFENFLACDRLLAICEDIYAARAEKELELEEGLFWTLIKIYRSPHILMEYTKVE